MWDKKKQRLEFMKPMDVDDQRIKIQQHHLTIPTLTQNIPKELDLIVKQNQVVTAEQPLTANPNVGGFGQAETEIVLQNPDRIIGYLVFCLAVVLCQIFLVIKKKQFEKVQAAEMNF